MSDLRVVLVQAEQTWKDKEKNLADFQTILDTLEPCDLIVLPEMFHTSFCMDAAELAEKMNDSLAVTFLQKNAKKRNAAIYTSFIAEAHNGYYNRGIFVFPSGEYEIYDKRKLFSLAGEDKIYTAGSMAKIVEYRNWRINLQICYDLRFPEIARNSILPNQCFHFDVSIYVANWPAKRSAHWKALLPARSIENQCYTIGVNRIGKDGNAFEYAGDSGVWNALGELETPKNKESLSLIYHTLEKNKLAKIRESLPFLKDS